jgi:hypothetical protein
MKRMVQELYGLPEQDQEALIDWCGRFMAECRRQLPGGDLDTANRRDLLELFRQFEEEPEPNNADRVGDHLPSNEIGESHKRDVKDDADEEETNTEDPKEAEGASKTSARGSAKAD